MVLGDHRVWKVDPATGLGSRVEEISFGADSYAHRGDELLPDSVQRRVRDLGEQLLEVVEQLSGPVRQGSHRSVCSHRADGLLGVPGHRCHQHLEFFKGVSEQLLALDRCSLLGYFPLNRGKVVEVDQVPVQPGLVGVGGDQFGLDLVVADDSSPDSVDEEHPSRLEPSFLNDLRRGDVEDADLAGHDDQTIVGHPVPAGPEAVAVQDGADHRPVGEGDRRGTVPGFHEGCVVLVEGPALGFHLAVVLPGFGDHHQNGLREREAAEGEQLKDLVEGRGITGSRGADRKQPFQVAGKEIGGQEGLPGSHPVPVALHGVDLPVVGQHPVRVGQRPGREGVRREA